MNMLIKVIRRMLAGFANLLPMKLRIPVYRIAGMKIGKGTKISRGFYVDRPDGVVIGENCYFNHFVHLHVGSSPTSSMTFGNNVFVGPETVFFCASHEIGTSKQRAGKNTYDSIAVEDGVWIGASCVVFPGVVIRQGCVIGACSTVTKSTDSDNLYYGSPVKEIRHL